LLGVFVCSYEQLGIKATTVSFPPVLLHVLVMAVFASLIAPFGGFFASGLKRAFKIKVRWGYPTSCPQLQAPAVVATSF